MKKIFVLVTLAMMLMTSCQPTPEDLAVKQKDGEALMEAITESDTSNGEDAESEESEINEPYSAETEWIETFLSDTGKFSCDINAKVEVPDLGVFPAIYVEPEMFTVDFIKNVVYCLVPAEISLNLYDGGSMLATAHYTEEQVEAIILSIQEYISDPNSNLNQLKETNPEAYEERLEIEMEALQKYLAMYESGEYPDEMTVEQLVVTEDLIKEGFIATNIPAAMTDPSIYEGITRYSLTVADTDDDGGIYNKISLNISDDSSGTGESLTLDELSEISNEIISKLGIEDMILSLILEPDISNEYYRVIYLRDYEGIPTTYTSNGVSMDSDAGTYSYAWADETIEIQLTSDGTLKSFDYTSPLTEGEIISADVDLISFDEIKEIFKKQIVYENIYLEDEHITGRDYYITDIKLGMMRVAVENEINKYMVIPVWDFYGYYTDTYDSQEHTEWALDDNNQRTCYDDDDYFSVLTINAIDGSIIDRSLGY